MDWSSYKEAYISAALQHGLSSSEIEGSLNYAEKLYNQGLPIVFDAIHLGQLIGISHNYMYKVSNDTTRFYRSFRIKKRTGGTRKISEPLPNLKIVQHWILNEILYKVKVHPSAKAYIKNVSIKENVRYHRNQDTVLKLDIERFFDNIGEQRIYKIFIELGYTIELSWLLTKLCTLNRRLPQGAVTSPYLSNLIMKKFDRKIYVFCRRKSIRYTRYADDITFSGEFNKHHVISRVVNELAKLKLSINEKKIRVLKSYQKQIITGIVVNKKIQVDKAYRKSIRQEVYYINKFGLDEHLKNRYNSGEANIIYKRAFLKSLIGKAEYVSFINKYDNEMPQYIELLRILLAELKDN